MIVAAAIAGGVQLRGHQERVRRHGERDPDERTRRLQPGRKLDPREQQAMVEQLEAGEAALADAVAELEEVEVPEEAQDGHPKLVAGIDDLRALFEQTAKDVQKAEGTDAFGAVTALASEGAVIGTEIDQAINQINDDLGADSSDTAE